MLVGAALDRKILKLFRSITENMCTICVCNKCELSAVHVHVHVSTSIWPQSCHLEHQVSAWLIAPRLLWLSLSPVTLLLPELPPELPV